MSILVSGPLKMCRTALGAFVRRAFGSVADSAPSPDAVEPSEFASSSDHETAEEETVPSERKRYDYNAQNLDELGYNTFPYHIERAWWKEGARMTFWPHWSILRDIKRRRTVAKYGPERMRYKAMKTNNILPRAIIDEFQERMNKMERRAHPSLVIQMCQFTARRRGKLNKFRVNRHVFREVADRGGFSGIQRAMW